MVVQMEAEDVANEVRQYSILVGFLLIIIFVVPCVGFALFSKYCQKQTRKKRHSTVSSLIQLQHRSTSLVRHFPPPEMVPVRDSPSDSSDHCSYGPLGQVDCSVDQLECLERMGAMGTCLSCLDTWKGQVPPGVRDDEAVGKLIVVKKISVSEAKVHMACLKNDLNTLVHIPPHPLLVNLLGVCMSGGIPQALMLEYPPHGSLHTFLILKRRAALSGNTKYWPCWTNKDRLPDILEVVKAEPSSLSPLLANPDVRCHPYSQPLNSCFSEVDLLLFALQIAAAMDHLASRNILHRSLSSENTLIGSGFFLKLTGMHTNPSQHHATSFRTLKRTASGRNLYKWDAPEVMETGEHSEKTEVWRFGMTIWEVTSLGDVPFAEIPNRSLSEILRSGQRPQAPDSCSHDLYNLMTDCWNLRPESRPTFSRIVERIQDMICFRPDRSCDDSDSMHRSVSPLCLDSTPPDHSHLHHRGRPKRPLIYTQYVNSPKELSLFNAPHPLPELESEELPDGYVETDV